MTRPRLVVLVVALGAALGACASADKAEAPPRPTAELAVGAKQLRGGGIRMDVQVGRSLTRRAGKAGAVVVTPHAVVTP